MHGTGGDSLETLVHMLPKSLLPGLIPDSPVCGPQAYTLYDTTWPWDSCWNLVSCYAEHGVRVEPSIEDGVSVSCDVPSGLCSLTLGLWHHSRLGLGVLHKGLSSYAIARLQG